MEKIYIVVFNDGSRWDKSYWNAAVGIDFDALITGAKLFVPAQADYFSVEEWEKGKRVKVHEYEKRIACENGINTKEWVKIS